MKSQKHSCSIGPSTPNAWIKTQKSDSHFLIFLRHVIRVKYPSNVKVNRISVKGVFIFLAGLTSAISLGYWNRQLFQTFTYHLRLGRFRSSPGGPLALLLSFPQPLPFLSSFPFSCPHFTLPWCHFVPFYFVILAVAWSFYCHLFQAC